MNSIQINVETAKSKCKAAWRVLSNDHETDIVFAVSMIFGLIAYSFWLRTHYSVDFYRFIDNPGGFVDAAASLGRLITAGIARSLMFIGVNPINFQLPLTVSSIIVYAFSSTRLYQLFCTKLASKRPLNHFGGKSLSFIAILLVVFNPFVASMFVFPENLFGTSLGFLFAVFAAQEFDKGRPLRAFLFAVFSTWCYQALVYVFPAIALLLMPKFSLRKTIQLAGMLVAALGVNFASAIAVNRILGTTRDQTRTSFLPEDIVANIEFLPKQLFNTTVGYFGYLPKYSILIFAIIVVGLFLVSIKRKEVKSLQKVPLALMSVSLFIIGPMLPLLFSGSTTSAARILMPGAAFGGVILLAYTIMVKKPSLIAFAGGGVLLLLFMFSALNLGAGQIAANAADQEHARIIRSALNEYEKETGEKVTKVKLYSDQRPSYCRIDTSCYPAVTTSSLMLGNVGATIFALEYYTNRDFSVVSGQPEIVDQNFRYFDPSTQIFIEDNVLNFIRF